MNKQLYNWIVGNLLWETLLLTVVVIMPSIFRIIWISRKLLSQNRDSRGNGWGVHLADRFVDMWYSSDKNPLRHFGNEMYQLFNNPNSRYIVQAIDKKLNNFGLVERDTATYDAVFKPVKNFRNRIILWIVESWLIFIIGDNRNYYNELRKRKRTEK